MVAIVAKLVNLRSDMILLADFGNTRVKVAVKDGDSLNEIYCGPAMLGNLKDAVSGMAVDGGMWCAVRPLENEIELWMRSMGLVPFKWDTPMPLQNGYSTPQTLGMDRLAAAVGAWSMNPGRNLLIIDAGTAITYDLVTSDGVYQGGNIAPGIEMRLKALHDYTGSLPLVQAHGDTPWLGSDTATAIRSGVVTGVRNEIKGYIHDAGQRYESVLVFLTGGDAEYFDLIDKSANFVAHNLVIRGLSCIVDYNENKI